MKNFAAFTYLFAVFLAALAMNSSFATPLNLNPPLAERSQTSAWPADIGFSNTAGFLVRTASEPVSPDLAQFHTLRQDNWQPAGYAPGQAAVLTRAIDEESAARVQATGPTGDRMGPTRTVIWHPLDGASSQDAATAAAEVSFRDDEAVAQEVTAPAEDRPQTRRISDDTLGQAYGAMDGDGDGVVSRAEWISWEGGGLSRFLAVDTNDDDRLSYSEYRQSVVARYGASRLSD